MIETQRSHYWDNAKGILIFLVVFAHYLSAGFIYSGNYQSAPNALYTLIYLFHMPLFVFVSGYFSKNVDKCRDTAFSQLLLPYVLVNALCILMEYFLFDGELSNPIFYPYGHTWYLISLFLYRYFAKDLVKLKRSWFWLLLFSLFCSLFSPGKTWVLLGNCLTFMPFFFLGLETTPEQIQHVKRIPKWLCVLILLAGLAAMYIALEYLEIPITSLGFFNENLPLSPSSLPKLGIILLRYILAAVLGICLLNLAPERECFLSKLGRNTMVIFLFHQLPGFRNLLYYLDPFKESTLLSFLWWLLWSAVMTFLLGTDRAAGIYRLCMAKIRKLLPLK